MKNKENRRVIAKIKYKEWNERKAEEARHKKMVDRMEKQRIKMDEQETKRLRLERIRNMKKRIGYGGQILLSYGLNKNLKQLNHDEERPRAKSAKGRRGRRLEDE